MNEQSELAEQLREARDTISQQRAALRALEVERADLEFAKALRGLIREVGAASELSESASQEDALEMLVQTAVNATRAQAGSLLVVDREAGNLVFRAATGPRSAEIRSFVVPLGQGIAGFVAESGQPIAVSNVQEDPRFFRDIGQSVQYLPNSILCVPVRRGDTILGVIELLDKSDGASFSVEDMNLVGSLSEQAAVAIGLSRDLHNLADLFLNSLRRLAGQSDEAAATEDMAESFVHREEQQPTHLQVLSIARTLADIATEGENELTLARSWLEAFLTYLRARPSIRY